MRLWAQSKFLSYRISDWCESREMGGRWSSRLPTNGGKLLCRPSSYEKLLDRVTFWIVYVAWRVGYKIVAYNATSVGVGRRNILFCVCVAEAVIIVAIIIVYIAVVVVCQNCQVNGPNKCKHEISGSLHCSVFFILFCYIKLRTVPHERLLSVWMFYQRQSVYHVLR